MANEEHLKILKQGVGAWNKWRRENRGINPDLSGADLTRGYLGLVDFSVTDLSLATLNQATLNGAQLFVANLRRASLRGADLTSADLAFADCRDADLGGADLSWAQLHHAFLNNAQLVGVDLRFANLSEAQLEGADIRGSFLIGTVLGDVDLGGLKGLEDCVHMGPSIIDHRTLQQSGMLPVEFLRGCGLAEWQIKAAELNQGGLTPGQVNDVVCAVFNAYCDKPVLYFSTVISYSHEDKDFAQTLHHYLDDEKGIRCWKDEHQMLPGDDKRDAIDRGIRLWDKVLLCCSKSSLNRYWVNTEIDKALKKEETLWRERGKKTLVLIPLNLDGYLFDWEDSRASVLTDRYAEDLVGWKKNPEKLKRALDRIEKALRADDSGREPPPEPRL